MNHTFNIQLFAENLNTTATMSQDAQIWYESVLKNCRVNKTTLHIDKPGKHTVKIICGDAGTVLQKIVLDFGGMKRSYSVYGKGTF